MNICYSYRYSTVISFLVGQQWIRTNKNEFKLVKFANFYLYFLILLNIEISVA